MRFQAKKWSPACFGLVLAAIASWRYFNGFSPQKDENFVITEYPKVRRKEYPLRTNCGLERECPKNSFPVYLTTGNLKDRAPELCVAGNNIIQPDYVDDVRGLNGAIVDSNNYEVVSVRNFDTFMNKKSEAISSWVDNVLVGDILIMFTCDDASEKLSGKIRAKFNQLGSGKIQNLQFRSQWYMITQRGLPVFQVCSEPNASNICFLNSGYTTYEEISHAKVGGWGQTLEFKGCVPKVIPKEPTIADDPLKENPKKVQFCSGKVHDKYKGFCNEPRFQLILPALLTNEMLINNSVLSLPIFLFASTNLEIFISAVDNLIHQPGITTSLIHILYENGMDDVPGISRIYGTSCRKLKFESTFENRLYQAREISLNLFPNKKYLIVLDSNVIPSPDFLFFFAQMLDTLEKDKTLSCVSAWACNCYQHDGDPELVYRVQGIPKYAALITNNDLRIHGNICAPDVSRVQGTEACQPPSTKPDNYIKRPQDLTHEKYYQKMVMLQQISSVLDFHEVLLSCSHYELQSNHNIIYLDNKEKIPQLVKRLGIRKNQFGIHDGVIRLFVKGKNVIIVTADSYFFKSRFIHGSNKNVNFVPYAWT